MSKCAFLTISNTKGWFIDDDLVHEPLRKLGWQIQNVPWDKPYDWNDFDLVVIRSTWDYQDRLKQFMDVLDEIDQSKAKLLNTLQTVKWNYKKNYLFDLDRKGVEIVPTIKRSSLNKNDIENSFKKFDTHTLIIKPIISANADKTFKIPVNDNADLEEIIGVFSSRECIIQPFMNNIIEEGEYSLIYFNGKLSHVILKTVRPGDFRVQEEHGGIVRAVTNPDPILMYAGEKAIKALPEMPLYARVDLVKTATDTFALMELELIEPSLYFRLHPDSATAFAECLDKFR